MSLRQKGIRDIEPDEIFLDAKNLPKFDTNQFEGRLERPISRRAFVALGIVCALVFAGFFARAFVLEVVRGEYYAARSDANALHATVLFANRGVIFDRNGVKLAWNAPAASGSPVALRKYDPAPGLGNLLGYVAYPQKDSSGFYYNDDFTGIGGAEKFFNGELAGTDGKQLVESDVSGKVVSSSVVSPPSDGSDVTLSIDADITSKLYGSIASVAKQSGFTGGAGVIMDVDTGEVVAMTSFPGYDSQTMTDHTDAAAIKQMLSNKNNPFLDRVTDGLYAPGSTVKPFVALAALAENIIDPATKILSTGSITVPNPYDPSHPSVFKDWRAQGWVDMEHAIAVSSDVYFYEVGGGFEDQKGLGISLIDKYMNMFGFGEDIPNGFFSGAGGTVPSPLWKAEHFDNEDWLIGDTYHTAIGQYGWQVTPIQMARAVAAVANGGKLIAPSILAGGNPSDLTEIPGMNRSYYDIVRTGMRMDVLGGVATGLNVPYVAIAAKTGTAQIGAENQYLNSWVTGFFPYDKPKYAFALVMEQGPSTASVGGVAAIRQVLDWLSTAKPEYLKG
ncbi:MAG: hypothetical protein KGH93_02355 [Patescibacteria group bacterium]|nr:hypothetical protein [Patescibacteria group bacterium]MDE1946019.1 hypothetical protein [Patescibacteria group bacterium]